MNSSIAITSTSNQTDTNLTVTEFNSEQPTSTPLVDLYYKHQDEPDFDCEFIYGISQYYNENENIIDPETDEDPGDLFNDNEWDADIYDPYLESTYF